MAEMLRLAPCVLATAMVALGVAGQRAAASDLLLLGVVIAAAAGLEAVAGVVDGERSRKSAVLAGLALLGFVAAGPARRPELALACVACAGLDRVRLRVWVRLLRAAESP